MACAARRGAANSASSNPVIAQGFTGYAPASTAAKALVISRSVTSKEPSARLGRASSGVEMPRSRAALMTGLRRMASESCTETVLRDEAKARLMGMAPRYR